jgi:trans-aconitate methyltransferase
MQESQPQAFDRVAGEYQQKALVQNKAAQKLLALLALQGREDVIDIGCGPGHITDTLSSLTRGRVVGADISGGMIAEARAQYPKLEFWQKAAEDLEGAELFDAVFCNSALQWFPDPPRALRAMFRLLRPGGRLGLACPAAWSSFEKAVLAATQAPEIAPLFQHWKSPWFLLPTCGAYQTLLEQAGLTTCSAELADEVSLVGAEQAYQIYLSGASNGYTGGAFYTVPVSEAYFTEFNRLVRQSLAAEARAGKVEVRFKRFFYLGEKRK